MHAHLFSKLYGCIIYNFLIQVVTNGLIEFGTPFYETITEIPQSGVSRHFVAPFATESFYNNQEVRYDVRYDTFLDGDSEMVAVSSFLRALLDNSGFNGQWMLVVNWYNVYSTFSFVSMYRAGFVFKSLITMAFRSAEPFFQIIVILSLAYVSG